MRVLFFILVLISGLSCKKNLPDNSSDTTKAEPLSLKGGLVAYFPFDGNYLDSSGNGNHGINNGAQLSTDRFGRNAKSVYLNGQSNWISVPVTNALLPNQISLSFWSKIPSKYTGNNQIGRIIRSRFFGYYFDYDSMSNNISFNVHTNDSSALLPTAISNGIKYNDDKWHSIIGTFDGKKVILYIDGKLLSAVNSSSQNIYYQPDGFIQFGKDGNSDSPLTALFNGRLDEIRIHNRALTQEEITY